MNPMGPHDPELAARARAKRKPFEPVLRSSLREAVLEAHRLATAADMMGDPPVDFIRRYPALGMVDVYVAGEEKPIRIFGFSDV